MTRFDVFVFAVTGDRCSIVIDKVNQADKGIYKVMARNTYGEAVSECTLHVEGEFTYVLGWSTVGTHTVCEHPPLPFPP